MSRIIPIPTSRVGDLFARQRLIDQVQLDQLALFRLQNQVSTGQRIQVPSEDAPAALRAINLQRLLDRKSQVRTNLEASNQYLGEAWSRLGFVSTELSKLRAEVVGVTGTVATDDDRRAVIQQIDGILGELISAGNAKYQGRFLFAGSRSQAQPYKLNGEYVEYLGNEGVLRSYVDIEQLFDTNLSGSDVFGGISAAVEGSVDLNPHVSSKTLVSAIHGGEGLGKNPAIAVSINNGTSTETKIIDLGNAVTLGDVARLIEAGAPTAGHVTAEVTSQGLVVRTGGNPITISEVAQGRTARQLGIVSDPNSVATHTIVGGDLNPAILKTTQLNDLLGTKAQLRIDPPGANNSLVLTASRNGSQYNNVNVQFVSGGTAGAEVATYSTGTLTVQIQEGVSTASQVAAAINAEGTFTASLDYRDAVSSFHVGTGDVPVFSSSNTTAGGGGESLDTQSGLVLTNGGQTVTLDVSGAETVEDLLNLIQGAGIGLTAEINSAKTGINVRSRLSGANFTIGENGGTTATQLGIRTFNANTKLAALNRGAGVPTTSAYEQLDTAKLDTIEIVARNGVAFSVGLTGASSLQDVIDLINDDPINHAGNTAVLARLTANGNAVELVDSSTPVSGRLTVVAGGQAAGYLGLLSPGAAQQTSNLTDASGNYVLSGTNVLGHDMAITASNGTKLWIDLANTKTIQDVLDRINNNPENTAIQARLAVTGNGIELVDSSGGSGDLIVEAVGGSLAAESLGLVPAGQTTAIVDTANSNGDFVLQGEDRHTLEVDSVFNTLVRLRDALQRADVAEIGRALERIDLDMERVNFARAELGGRLQNLDVIDTRLQDEDVQLRGALSKDLDVDLVQAISDLTARQYAFEASLRTAASLMQISLLNFI